ncbi:cysteine-rich CWC family protein [Pseudomonas sp.]|uniref:cysteine-rich CWC family protein n=1 Tax=Pseudomonas sp. TaxID=306 RepID=UPI0026313213|nr:cysteine-rich CWC family protein [Pseudomonas sp.]
MTPTDCCPACGARNNCSMANAASQDTPCWCFSVHIEPSALEALPPEWRNQACLCPNCAKAQGTLPSALAKQLT